MGEPALASWTERWTLAPTNLRSPVMVGSETKEQKMLLNFGWIWFSLTNSLRFLLTFSSQIMTHLYLRLEITPQSINSWGIYSASTTVMSCSASTCIIGISNFMRNSVHQFIWWLNYQENLCLSWLALIKCFYQPLFQLSLFLKCPLFRRGEHTTLLSFSSTCRCGTACISLTR